MTDDTTTHEVAAAAARLRAWFQDTSGLMVMDEADFDDVQTLLADYERRAAEPLHDEFGLRVVYTSTEIFEGAVAETEAEARATLAGLDDEDRADVVSRTLIHRKVTDWEAR